MGASQGQVGVSGERCVGNSRAFFFERRGGGAALALFAAGAGAGRRWRGGGGALVVAARVRRPAAAFGRVALSVERIWARDRPVAVVARAGPKCDGTWHSRPALSSFNVDVAVFLEEVLHLSAVH